MTILHVRLLDDTLAGRLTAAVRAGRPVRLGGGEYQVAAPPRQTGRAAWPDLRSWSGERAWQVRFVTPVCLRRGHPTSPWPAPESVARGLAERWRRLDPATATAPPLPVRGAGPVWVSDIEGPGSSRPGRTCGPPTCVRARTSLASSHRRDWAALRHPRHDSAERVLITAWPGACHPP